MDLYIIAKKFREAIEEAKCRGEFCKKDKRHNWDRMMNFPNGCCDDTCDLLGYYLKENFEIFTEQVVGRYETGNYEDLTNHVWLVTTDNEIIDITGDQFERNPRVYVGPENDFYKSLGKKHIQKNYDISKDDRLKNDYDIILKYINGNLHGIHK